jgi:hypothetical protein
MHASWVIVALFALLVGYAISIMLATATASSANKHRRRNGSEAALRNDTCQRPSTRRNFM